MAAADDETNNNLQSLRYSIDDNGIPKLQVLDQLKVPHEKVYIDVSDVQGAWTVIRSMQIRGAPLIAIVAVLGLAVDLTSNPTTREELAALNDNRNDLLAYIQGKMDYLATARPTAVNVFHALQEVKTCVETETTASGMCLAIAKHAKFMLQRDVNDNKSIGRHGAEAILKQTHNMPARIMTICNTGSLATAGYGTALGVVRTLKDQGMLQSVAALETRPYNQGSRLTAFEIVEEQMPGGTLICDSMAASYMKIKGVDACVVGADRVCANGDTANKIGTYALSLVAAAHHVPFYVASPFTTLDLSLKSGDDIVIEERPSQELVETSGAPPSIPCWNPAFDVTPAKYIAGIITEKGVIEPNIKGELDVTAFVKKHTADEKMMEQNETEAVATKLEVPFDYEEQSVTSLPGYLAKNAPAAMEALDTASPDELSCVEVGDGNLNLVFIVTNTQNQKQVIVKQALPYVRCVGESWPLTLERAYFEFRALSAEKEACPAFVPNLFYFSRPHGLMVMEFIPPPNIILRKGLIQGIRYPTMASDMGTFCAHTLFKSSGFQLSETELRAQVQFWETNSEMCALTEQVIFTEPYITAPNNRWTSPQLDAEKAAIEQDTQLKIAASRLKNKFVTETQALLHADLHTGSVMCSPAPHQTFVIDPEFAFYGPMGFDTGAFIANLFLSFCSQGGHDNGDDYAAWILEQIITFWNVFETEFVKLWDDAAEHTGMSFKRVLLGEEDARKQSQKAFMTSLLADTLGFAGMKMLRRIVGIAHVEDLDSIEDPDVRANCERHSLQVAKIFIKTGPSIASIEEAVEIAKNKKG